MGYDDKVIKYVPADGKKLNLHPNVFALIRKWKNNYVDNVRYRKSLPLVTLIERDADVLILVERPNQLLVYGDVYEGRISVGKVTAFLGISKFHILNEKGLLVTYDYKFNPIMSTKKKLDSIEDDETSNKRKFEWNESNDIELIETTLKYKSTNEETKLVTYEEEEEVIRTYQEDSEDGTYFIDGDYLFREIYLTGWEQGIVSKNDEYVMFAKKVMQGNNTSLTVNVLGEKEYNYGQKIYKVYDNFVLNMPYIEGQDKFPYNYAVVYIGDNEGENGDVTDANNYIEWQASIDFPNEKPIKPKEFYDGIKKDIKEIEPPPDDAETDIKDEYDDECLDIIQSAIEDLDEWDRDKYYNLYFNTTSKKYMRPFIMYNVIRGEDYPNPIISFNKLYLDTLKVGKEAKGGGRKRNDVNEGIDFFGSSRNIGDVGGGSLWVIAECYTKEEYSDWNIITIKQHKENGDIGVVQYYYDARDCIDEYVNFYNQGLLTKKALFKKMKEKRTIIKNEIGATDALFNEIWKEGTYSFAYFDEYIDAKIINA